MIREVKNEYSKKTEFSRLDFSKGEIQDAVKKCLTPEDFDKVFTKYGKAGL